MQAAVRVLPSVAQLTRALKRQHGWVPVPPPKTAFEWVLWENVAYLADDAQRMRAFELLRASVGLTPEAILGASNPALLAVTRHGIVAPLFARKLRQCAQLARDRFDGDVDRALSSDVTPAARQLLVFPGIGEPGAEKILVALGRARTLPLESNGLRVLLRVGFGKETRSYASTYRSVKQALPATRASSKSLLETHFLLQRHGRDVCKRSAPECGWCRLRPVCRYGTTIATAGAIAGSRAPTS